MIYNNDIHIKSVNLLNIIFLIKYILYYIILYDFYLKVLCILEIIINNF